MDFLDHGFRDIVAPKTITSVLACGCSSDEMNCELQVCENGIPTSVLAIYLSPALCGIVGTNSEVGIPFLPSQSSELTGLVSANIH